MAGRALKLETSLDVKVWPLAIIVALLKFITNVPLRSRVTLLMLMIPLKSFISKTPGVISSNVGVR